MSGILPLTTTFKPPTSCLTSLMKPAISTVEDQLGPSPSATECFPSGFKFESNFYFSPGLCPDGYKTVASGTNQIGSLVETTATCCPTGFSWVNNALSSKTCLSHYRAVESVAVYSGTSFSLLSRGGGYAIASVVQVRYQATDQAILTPHATTATVTSTVTVQATEARVGGLATGAKVGIGIGVPTMLLLLIAIGVGITLWRQRRTRYVAAQQGDRKAIGELDGSPVANGGRMFELGS